MFFWLLGIGAAALLGGGAVILVLDVLEDAVGFISGWLRDHDLESSWLMTAVVRFEMLGNRVKKMIKVRGQGRRRNMTIKEEVIPNGEAPQEILDRLSESDAIEEDVLDMVY